MTRLVLKLPHRLAKKVEDAADEADMLPTEWVRNLIRETLSGEPDEETEPAEDEG